MRHSTPAQAQSRCAHARRAHLCPSSGNKFTCGTRHEALRSASRAKNSTCCSGEFLRKFHPNQSRRSDPKRIGGRVKISLKCSLQIRSQLVFRALRITLKGILMPKSAQNHWNKTRYPSDPALGESPPPRGPQSFTTMDVSPLATHR